MKEINHNATSAGIISVRKTFNMAVWDQKQSHNMLKHLFMIKGSLIRQCQAPILVFNRLKWIILSDQVKNILGFDCTSL